MLLVTPDMSGKSAACLSSEICRKGVCIAAVGCGSKFCSADMFVHLAAYVTVPRP